MLISVRYANVFEALRGGQWHACLQDGRTWSERHQAVVDYAFVVDLEGGMVASDGLLAVQEKAQRSADTATSRKEVTS